MKLTQLLFLLLRNALFDVEIDENTKLHASKHAEDLYKISKHHDIAHLVAYAFEKCGIEVADETLKKNLRKKRLVSVIRYERLLHDFNIIKDVLDGENIEYIPLKGSVIRDLYPEPWMRSSCDIDILVRENDLDRAVTSLCEKGTFTSDNKRDFHDVSLFSETGTHLELHFSIMENLKDVDEILEKVWDYSEKSAENSCMYMLKNEFLIFHILSHMCFHVINGGCGVRSFVDLYLLEKNLEYDENVLCDICQKGGLLKFKTACEKLSRIWMDDEACDEDSKIFAKYVLSGGTYGSMDAAASIQHAAKGGKAKYILTRIFQPYNILKEKYPVLKKHRWLVPVCQVRRWFSILTSDKREMAADIFKAGGTVTDEQAREKVNMLSDMGIGDK